MNRQRIIAFGNGFDAGKDRDLVFPETAEAEIVLRAADTLCVKPIEVIHKAVWEMPVEEVHRVFMARGEEDASFQPETLVENLHAELLSCGKLPLSVRDRCESLILPTAVVA